MVARLDGRMKGVTVFWPLLLEEFHSDCTKIFEKKGLGLHRLASSYFMVITDHLFILIHQCTLKAVQRKSICRAETERMLEIMILSSRY